MANRREKLEADLAALATYSPAQLRTQWARMTGKPLPKVSPKMLRLALGYELQAKALGRLPRAARQQLDNPGRGKPAPVRWCRACDWCGSGTVPFISSPCRRTARLSGMIVNGAA